MNTRSTPNHFALLNMVLRLGIGPPDGFGSVITAALWRISSRRRASNPSKTSPFEMAQQQITAKKQQGSSGAVYLTGWQWAADYFLKSCNYSIQAIRTAFSRLLRRLVMSSRRRKNISNSSAFCDHGAPSAIPNSYTADFHVLTASLLFA